MQKSNRFSKISRQTVMLACVLALGGTFSGCTDDYDLDTTTPSWLNESIYETLEKSGDHSNFLRLINDPDVSTTTGTDESTTESLKAKLSRTGSNTVFAANDESWNQFFQNNATLDPKNPWHNATSYENLSKSQKKLLLHTCMLNNAIVMENLASSAGDDPTRGQYMRRSSDYETTDTVTYIAVEDLPHSYWSADKQKHAVDDRNPAEVDQWSRIKNGDKHYTHIYMVQDSSESMMMFFTREFMANNQITDADFKVLMNGQTRTTDDVHIYNSHLDNADVVCLNGYLEYTSKPLVPLANMAEVIRTNGRTNIFSHILERFSVPYQNKTVGDLFANLYPDKFKSTDTLYTKRYISKRSWGSTQTSDKVLNKAEKGSDLFAHDGLASLKFDPGWNAYFPNGKAAEEDMGAIFVPNDDQMLNYFSTGGGRTLIEEYTLNPYAATQYGKTGEGLINLFKDIDQIPLKTIQDIVNQGMFDRFTESVPSKMYKLRETTTQERIFTDDKDFKLQSDGGNIEKVELACNGPVYIMNNVYTPSNYNCVATPAYISSENLIMHWAIFSDYDLGNSALMGINYYAYLKAMQSRFTFFMPCDEGMLYNYDPMSFTAQTSSTKKSLARVMRFLYTANGTFPFVTSKKTGTFDGTSYYVISNYDIDNGKITTNQTTQYASQDEILNRLRLMLEDITIVRKDGNLEPDAINNDEDEYYVSKSGMGIKVTRDVVDGVRQVVSAQGGFQLENEREIDKSKWESCDQGVLKANVKLGKGGVYHNGTTFVMDAPLIPAARSVFSLLSNLKRGSQADENAMKSRTTSNNPYEEFFELCYPLKANASNLIIKSGLVKEKEITTAADNQKQKTAINKYLTFADTLAVDYNVTFWQKYRYTVFVPSNEAMQNAIAHGLQTWDKIEEDYEAHCDEYGNLLTYADSMRIQAKITYLNNFIRGHFADDSFFADKTATSSDEKMVTSSYNETNKKFTSLTVRRIAGGDGTILQVKDGTASAEFATAYSKDPDYGRDVRNIMTCDRTCNKEVNGSRTSSSSINGTTVESSNFAVVHLIDKVLNHTELEAGGTYPSFNDVGAARRYLKKFAIR